ncbi:hypothetical protein [Kitasatospora sp. NPDC097643]|uniref:hypothetical protein n=1 Tax=Kitasatospora sp. NPDC097643 TaxID=3157230 RepID=UPI00332AC38C
MDGTDTLRGNDTELVVTAAPRTTTAPGTAGATTSPGTPGSSTGPGTPGTLGASADPGAGATAVTGRTGLPRPFLGILTDLVVGLAVRALSAPPGTPLRTGGRAHRPSFRHHPRRPA